MLFKNILVPFDLSSPAHHAFKVALEMAQLHNSKITLISCVEEDTWHHKYYDSRIYSQLLIKKKKTAEKYMKKLEVLANKAGVNIKFQVLRSTSVVKDITIFAKSKKMDLIVMSSHGRTGWDKLILGSVANGVIQRTRIPVLLIK